MSRLIMWNVVTLDGCFEGARSWDLDFHQSVWGPELEAFSIEQLRTADRLLFGRVTYEGMAAYWRTATGEVAGFMNRLPKVVFSRTLKDADWAHTTLVREDAAGVVPALKRQGDGNSFVFGSGRLCAALLDRGLFDEIRLALAPVLLGNGRPLFERGLVPARFSLLETRTLARGCVVLRYGPGAAM